MTRKLLLVVATLVLVVSIWTAIALPPYACPEGYHLFTFGPGAPLSCFRIHVGFSPASRMPLKLGVGVAGAAVTAVLALAAFRPRRIPCD